MREHHIEIASQMSDERLRQERETFDLHKTHQNRWFHLRLAMGWVAVVLLLSIMAVSGYVLVNHALFPITVVTAAGGALFVDALGLVVSVWKIVLDADFMTKLAPITEMPQSDVSSDDAQVGASAEVVHEELTIYSAKYGTEGKDIDVIEFVRARMAAGRIEMHVSNDNLGGYPVAGLRNALKVVYSHAGDTHTKKFREGEMLSLP